jgi:hypothetical protein
MGVTTAIGQVRSGQAQAAGLKGQAAGLETQAEFKRLEGKQASLVHKKKAVDQLQGILEHMSSVNARAGAGSIDPFSGNPEGIKVKGLNVGGLNVVVSNENFAITRLVSEGQAQQLEYQAARARAAASAAKQAGITSAMMTLAMTAFSAAQSGMFDGGLSGNDAMSFNTPGNIPTAMRYGTNIGSQQTSMLALQDAGMFMFR